jgi:hypothetical protein
MKKLNLLNLLFLLVISMALQITFNEVWHVLFYKEKPNVMISNEGEYFDPALLHLTSIKKFAAHCDSVYGKAQISPRDSNLYADIVSMTLRGRFYHGYSYYKLGQNFFAHILAPALNKNLSAIVIPNDILNYPYAACSQQSIIGMEVFQRKGFNVRKVGFQTDKYGGHFCFEVWYEKKWHYFDPDKEPVLQTMIDLDHPSIAEIVSSDSLLYALYPQLTRDYAKTMFSTYFYGKPNVFPAKNARIYQYATKYLSYSLWFWLALLYFFVRRRVRNNKKKETCAELQDLQTSEREVQKMI